MTESGPAPLAVEKFSHICIGVSDVERSLEFYRRLFGFDVVFDVELEGESLEAVTGEAGAKGRMVGGLLGGTMVELLGLGSLAGRGASGPAHGPRLGYTNISLSVPDLDAAFARVGDLGYEAQPPVEIAGVRMFFVADPDGTPIEVIEFPGDARTSGELWRGRQD